MSDPEINKAFETLTRAVENAGSLDDMDLDADQIFAAVEVISPGMTEMARDLPTCEIEKALMDFCSRALDPPPGAEAGNTSLQSFSTLVVMAEVKRRAALEGLTPLEWGRRERIRGFV